MVRSSQKIIKNQNGEEGISRNGELQGCWSCEREADSIQPVEIELHRDAAAFDDHLLKRPGLPLTLGQLFLLRRKPLDRSPGGEAKSKNKRERETGER